jgi:hypothetical protein
LHTINNKKGKKGYCTVKLDMHKAYDRVEWCFLENMLKLGFDAQWVSFIMACVSSVRYKIRFISNETEFFTPMGGIRQGDPLSPYLFLLYAEALSCMLNHAEYVESLVGVKVCREAPMLLHLLFANDSLILMEANEENARALKQILDLYCAISGQLVSVAKCSVFLAPTLHLTIKF